MVKTFNINDVELRGRVLQLIDEILLPKSLSPRARAAGLVHIFAGLDAEARTVFARIFSTRQRVQAMVQRFASDPNDDQARVPSHAWVLVVLALHFVLLGIGMR